MPSQTQFFDEVRLAVAAYLDVDAFDAAVTKLASVLRRHVPGFRRDQRSQAGAGSLEEPTPGAPGVDTMMVFETIPLAPGRPAADEDRASRLFAAAAREARSQDKDAT